MIYIYVLKLFKMFVQGKSLHFFIDTKSDFSK